MDTDQTSIASSVSIGARSVATPALLPLPKCDVTIRDATLADVPFIDVLQKKHGKQVGFLRTAAIEGKIAKAEIIVAEDAGVPVGYCMASDRYFKHDDVGIIYQLNVVPGRQRGFVGANLLRAQFERSAYGCKLYCCWCAQDLQANYFWEAMGFRAIAFRAGSERKSRIHIFWQKRIRRGDTTTPWWYPSETTGGSMAAARLALPIPPGVHWSEVMPIVLPGMEEDGRSEISDRSPQPAKGAAVTRSSGLKFGVVAEPVIEKPAEEKPKEVRVKKPKAKNDPRLVAAARELRDRWLEQMNGGERLIEQAGKYDVARWIEGNATSTPELIDAPRKRLPLAA